MLCKTSCACIHTLVLSPFIYKDLAPNAYPENLARSVALRLRDHIGLIYPRWVGFDWRRRWWRRLPVKLTWQSAHKRTQLSSPH